VKSIVISNEQDCKALKVVKDREILHFVLRTSFRMTRRKR